MIESIESLRAAASAQGTKRLAVACAQDDHVLLAAEKARRLGIAEAILDGCEQQIRRIAAEHALDLTPYRIIDEPDNAAACRIAVSLVKNGEADAVMKGPCRYRRHSQGGSGQGERSAGCEGAVACGAV